jgi:hypothetical protein
MRLGFGKSWVRMMDRKPGWAREEGSGFGAWAAHFTLKPAMPPRPCPRNIHFPLSVSVSVPYCPHHLPSLSFRHLRHCPHLRQCPLARARPTKMPSNQRRLLRVLISMISTDPMGWPPLLVCDLVRPLRGSLLRMPSTRGPSRMSYDARWNPERRLRSRRRCEGFLCLPHRYPEHIN